MTTPLKASENAPYDVNFSLPVPSALESERVKLIPFIPSKHAPTFFAASHPHPELYEYLPFGPYDTCTALASEFLETRVRKNPQCILFAICDKTQAPTPEFGADGALAGILGLLNTSSVNLATEIGFVIVLPAFQRTHVASNAVGLLLHYCLDLPAEGGLGLRRVVWQANALNRPSVGAAERMGFRLEGVLRWDRVIPKGRVHAGNRRGEREGDPKAGYEGRDTAMLGLCWDDWEGGAREKVDAIMARKS